MDRLTYGKVGYESSHLKKFRIWRIQIRIHNIFKIYQRTNRKYPSRETVSFKENNRISWLLLAMVMLYLSVPLSPEYVGAFLWSGLRSFRFRLGYAGSVIWNSCRSSQLFVINEWAKPSIPFLYFTFWTLFWIFISRELWSGIRELKFYSRKCNRWTCGRFPGS